MCMARLRRCTDAYGPVDVNCYRFICVGVDVKYYRLFSSYCIYLGLQLLAFRSVKPAVIPSMNKPAVSLSAFTVSTHGCASLKF